MAYLEQWSNGLGYTAFLDKYASPPQRIRWDAALAAISLTEAQTATLAKFRRTMPVMIVAGAWCGDCVSQCPIFEHFARATPTIQIRYFDRDSEPALAEELSVCGGHRVPAVLWLSEDGFPCGRYGDKTLSAYRNAVDAQSGEACSTGLAGPGGGMSALTTAVVADWLREFERIQLLLQMSGRLRKLHGD